MRSRVTKTAYELTAANGTPIATYGPIVHNLNLGLRRMFQWKFIIADVDRPIIGVDFLSFFGLLVDVRNKRLIDSQTSLCTIGKPAAAPGTSSLRVIAGSSAYHQLLARFPEITRPSDTPAPSNTT